MSGRLYSSPFVYELDCRPVPAPVSWLLGLVQLFASLQLSQHWVRAEETLEEAQSIATHYSDGKCSSCIPHGFPKFPFQTKITKII